MKNENKNNSKVSRGYAGYVITYDGRTEYLRSSLEFIYFKYIDYLSSKYSHINYTVEEFYTMQIQGKGYRPDFIIYKYGKIRKIIEIKSDKSIAEKYLKLYSEYFKELGISYSVVYDNKWFSKIVKLLGIKEDLESYKRNSIYDYSGKNNPRYGIKASEKTKALIGQTTKSRFNSSTFCKKHREGVLKAMNNPVVREKLSLSRKKCEEEKRKNKNKVDPYINKKCEICGENVRKRKSKFITIGYATCSSSCTQKYKHEHGMYPKRVQSAEYRVKNISSRIRNDYNKIIAIFGEFDINKAREYGIVAKNSPCSIKSIIQYFNKTEKEIVDGKINL